MKIRKGMIILLLSLLAATFFLPATGKAAGSIEEQK